MKFTVSNLKTEFQKLTVAERSTFQEQYDNVMIILPKYNINDKVKKAIDMLISRLNQRYGDKTPAPASKPAKTQKTKAERKKKQPKPKPQKPQYTGNYVEKILPEVAFIRRYVALHDKKFTSETKNRAIRLLSSLQKAIVEKQIRKTSGYAHEIMNMQDSLIKLANGRADGSIISIAGIERLREIAKSEKISDKVAIIKQFLSIQGKENVKERAKSLWHLVCTKKGEYAEVCKSLVDYINGKTATPEVSAQFLSGLYGLAGIDTPEAKSGVGISANKFIASNFETMDFTGQWREFIGLPSNNFKIMLYGKAGCGKSTFALKFAQYLAASLGLQVLYIAGEEKFGYTLHEKVVRLNISSPNLYLIDKIPSDISKYDVVFIDSVNTLALSPEYLERLPKSKAYVWIFQCTKDGNYRGEQAYEHNADTVIEIADMKALMHKNRFGGKVPEIAV